MALASFIYEYTDMEGRAAFEYKQRTAKRHSFYFLNDQNSFAIKIIQSRTELLEFFSIGKFLI